MSKRKYTLSEVRSDITANRSRVRGTWLTLGHGEDEYRTAALECVKADPRGDMVPYAIIYRHPGGKIVMSGVDESCISMETLLDFVLPKMQDFDQLLILVDAMQRGWKP